MVMYRFICARAHQLLCKITVYTTYSEQQRQPGAANVVAEQLKMLISNNGGRLSDCYMYEGGLLRATIIRHPRFKSAETAEAVNLGGEGFCSREPSSRFFSEKILILSVHLLNSFNVKAVLTFGQDGTPERTTPRIREKPTNT